MMTVDTAAGWLSVALEPLGAITDDNESLTFVAELGWTLPGVPAAWRDLISAANDMLGSLATVIDGRARVAAGEADDSVDDELALAADLATLISSVAGLGAGLRAQLPAAYVAATGIDGALLDRLYATLIERFLREKFGLIRAVLVALGVIEISEQPDDPAHFQPAYTKVELHWDRLSTALTNPALLLHDVYGWGTDQIDSARLFTALVRLSYFFGVPAEIHYPEPATLTALDPAHGTVAMTDLEAELWMPIYVDGNDGLFAVLTPLPVTPGAPQRMAVTLALRGSVAASIPLTSTVTLAIDGAAQFGSAAAVVFGPTEAPRVVIDGAPDAGSGRIGAAVRFARVPGPTRLLALSDDTAIDVEQIELAIAATRSAGSPPDATIELGMTKLHVGVSAGDSAGDGLMSALIPKGLNATLDGRLVWSTATGVHLSGGGGLSFSVPSTAAFGPLRLSAVGLGIGVTTDGVGLTATVSGTASLGPVTLGLDAVGMRASLGFGGGNLGPLDLDLAFQAPQRISFGVTAGPILGGGALSVGAAAGSYAGGLALGAFEVELSAYGLLQTKPPTGGYALAAIISTQFRPIPLGLGFTLNGVGGLIGINRRVDTDALRAALRGPGIENIFFASDPVAQASRLLDDLATYFPAAPGHYVFGPAAKLGWGTPTIVEAELAVLLEMPSPVRLVLLGSLHTKLPTKDHPLIQLQVDVVGELNITEQRLAIDATLRDSFVVGFPIVGDFALRAAWGGQKQFVVSVGGFHSQFRPPPGFPTLRRVLIPIGADDDPRLDITGFLALTSNTAQVGAQIELYASAGPLNITGSVGFEALFQRSPLSFQVDLWAGVSLRRGKTVLAGVHLDGKLSGPTPWHVAGEACLSLWFVDLCVDFSATFGSSTPIVLPSLSIFDVLVPLLEDAASWAESLGEGIARRVTTSPPVDAANPTSTRLEPSAGLTVRQSVVPFNRRITRFAQSTPTDVDRVEVTTATVGSASGLTPVPVTDWFAPAEFEDMSDADRLSRDGFEQMDAGVSVAGDATSAGLELVVPLEYETVIVAPATPKTGPRFRPSLVAQLLSGQLGTREATPKLVARGGLPEEKFVIASVDDLGARLDLAPAGTRGTAELALAAHIAANPADAHAFVVLPMFEAA